MSPPGARAAGLPHPREFFERDPRQVAPDLLGSVLVSTLGGAAVALRLTETEAYLGEGEDPGSHAHRGMRPRTVVMFGPPGHVYVYFTYGMHWCANLVCHPAGASGAVLLRAGQIVDGASVARSRRPAAQAERDLARGPARLATALGIDGAVNGLDLFSPDGGLTVLSGEPVPARQVRSGPRVGVSGPGGTSPWRYWLDGDRTVSAYRPGRPARRST